MNKKHYLVLAIITATSIAGFYFPKNNTNKIDESFGATPAIRVTQGGTGTTTLANNEVLIGNGTSTIRTLATSSLGITSSQWTTVSSDNISFSGTTTQDNIKARTSAGFNILSSAGAQVANFGPGGGQAVSFYNGGSFANYLRVGGSAHTDSIFESMATTIDGSTGIIHGYNASSTEVFALNSDGDIDIGVWKGTAIADAYISSASNWNTAYTTRVATWTAPLQFSSNTASITVAASTTNGYLTSTDWNTFNQKADASSVSNLLTLYYWNGAADIAGYEMFRSVPNGGTEIAEATTTVANTYHLIDSYVSSSTAANGGFTFTSIPAGTFRFHSWATVNNAAGTNVLVYQAYKRASSGAETLLFTATSSALATSLTAENDTSYTYTGTTSSADGTDRFVVKVYAFSSASSRTITFYYDGATHYSHVETPFTFSSRGYVRTFDNLNITGNWTFSNGTTFGGAVTANQVFANVVYPGSSWGMADTNASHYLGLRLNSDLTATRYLTLVTGDADRTLTLSGDTTLSGTNTGNETTSTIGSLINGSTASTTPEDTDRFSFSFSSILQYVTWANIKATLKTYFDTLYGAKTLTPSFTLASTTLMGGASTSTIPLGYAGASETWNNAICGSVGATGVGTTTIRFGDGTNYTNTLTVTSTAYSLALSSNNTFTLAEPRFVQVITTAGSPNYITCTILKQ